MSHLLHDGHLRAKRHQQLQRFRLTVTRSAVDTGCWQWVQPLDSDRRRLRTTHTHVRVRAEQPLCCRGITYPPLASEHLTKATRT